MKTEDIKKLEIDKDKRYLLFLEVKSKEDIQEIERLAEDLKKREFDVFVIATDNLNKIKIIDFERN